MTLVIFLTLPQITTKIPNSIPLPIMQGLLQASTRYSNLEVRLQIEFTIFDPKKVRKKGNQVLIQVKN